MEQLNTENFGFVILCPERNVGGLMSTVCSVQYHFPDKPYLCVVGDDATPDELKEFGGICRTLQGGKTYTSLINLGIRESRAAWVFLFMAGAVIRHGVFNKYRIFCTDNKHVMFPVIDRKWMFDEASINGLFLNRNALKEVGEFSEEEEDFQMVKLLWASKAMEKGYQFRALVGVPR
jgi:hypothetical protein